MQIELEECEDGPRWSQGSYERAEDIPSNHISEEHDRILTCSFLIGQILITIA